MCSNNCSWWKSARKKLWVLGSEALLKSKLSIKRLSWLLFLDLQVIENVGDTELAEVTVHEEELSWVPETVLALVNFCTAAVACLHNPCLGCNVGTKFLDEVLCSCTIWQSDTKKLVKSRSQLVLLPGFGGCFTSLLYSSRTSQKSKLPS